MGPNRGVADLPSMGVSRQSRIGEVDARFRGRSRTASSSRAPSLVARLIPSVSFSQTSGVSKQNLKPANTTQHPLASPRRHCSNTRCLWGPGRARICWSRLPAISRLDQPKARSPNPPKYLRLGVVIVVTFPLSEFASTGTCGGGLAGDRAMALARRPIDKDWVRQH
jgi:hypothetical protein